MEKTLEKICYCLKCGNDRPVEWVLVDFNSDTIIERTDEVNCEECGSQDFDYKEREE